MSEISLHIFKFIDDIAYGRQAIHRDHLPPDTIMDGPTNQGTSDNTSTGTSISANATSAHIQQQQIHQQQPLELQQQRQQQQQQLELLQRQLLQQQHQHQQAAMMQQSHLPSTTNPVDTNPTPPQAPFMHPPPNHIASPSIKASGIMSGDAGGQTTTASANSALVATDTTTAVDKHVDSSMGGHEDTKRTNESHDGDNGSRHRRRTDSIDSRIYSRDRHHHRRRNCRSRSNYRRSGHNRERRRQQDNRQDRRISSNTSNRNTDPNDPKPPSNTSPPRRITTKGTTPKAAATPPIALEATENPSQGSANETEQANPTNSSSSHSQNTHANNILPYPSRQAHRPQHLAPNCRLKFQIVYHYSLGICSRKSSYLSTSLRPSPT